MPWKIFRESSKYCVHKLNPDDSKGKKESCFDTRDDAESYMRAKYASENKDNAEMEEKQKDENNEKMLGVTMYTSATNFDELEQEEQIHEQMMEVEETAQAIKSFTDNILYSDSDDKLGMFEKMFAQAKDKLQSIFGNNKDKEKDVEQVEESDLMITKNADGRYVWLARYSNNARDNDNPPEIIAAKSHSRFVQMVDKGLFQKPIIMLWHEKMLKFGDAEVVGFDEENGIAWAAGFVDDDKKELAKELQSIPPHKIGLSHGMPIGSIMRDTKDPSIIIEHQTKEITVLPEWAAANQINGFVLEAQIKEKEKMIDPKKKDALEEMGISSETIANLEQSNDAAKEKIQDAGIETKQKAEGDDQTPEVEEAEKEQDVTDPVAEEADEPEVKASEDVEPEPDPTPALTVNDVADAIAMAVKPIVEAMQPMAEANKQMAEQIQTLKKELDELKQDDQEKIEKQIQLTPRESLFANLGSALGFEGNAVDGRTKEGKDGPKETPHEKSGPSVAIPFLTDPDNWRDTFQELQS